MLALGVCASVATALMTSQRTVLAVLLTIGAIALHALLFRLFLWVYRPIERVDKMVGIGFATRAVEAILELARHAIEVDRASREGHGSNEEHQPTKARLAALRFVLWLLGGARHLLPQKREQLFPILLVAWIGLAFMTILFFAVAIRSLGPEVIRFAVPVVGQSSLWRSVVGSFALFSGAPIASVVQMSAVGFALCVTETLDALYLVGLFLVFLIRLVPYDASKRFEKLEGMLGEADEEIEVVLEVTKEQITDQRLASEEEEASGD